MNCNILQNGGPSRMRSSSPESVASSSRSWNKRYTNNYLTHTKNYTWRKAESVYSSDDEYQEKLQSKLAFKPNNKNSSRPHHLPHPETFVFHYQPFEQINVCSLEEKTFESTRVDWFGMLEGRFSGKDLPLKYFHQPQDLKTSALDLMIDHKEDKLYLPVDINEHINEMLHYIMVDYHKPSIFMKMCSDVQFVCSRLEIAQLLAVPYLHSQLFSYNPNFGYDIIAARQKGKIYLCMYFSVEEKMSRKLDFANQRLQQSNVGGLMFQKYLLSDSPDFPPDVKVPYDRKGAEYFVVDEVQVAENNKILLLNKFKAVSKEGDLDNLMDFELFDIKTSAKPYKLRNLFQKWTRCLAGNMEKMVMGIKSKDSTQVNDVEILRRQELLDQCQELYIQEKKKLCGNNVEFDLHPQPKICVDFLDKFLTFARTTLTKDTAWDEVYRFKFRPSEIAGSIRVERLVGKQSSPYLFMDTKFREWLKK